MGSFVVIKEEVNIEMKVETKRNKKSEWSKAYQRKQRELARRFLAGEDVPGIGEEERRKIIEREERRKQKNRERTKKMYYEREKMVRERKRRICAGEDVPGVWGGGTD